MLALKFGVTGGLVLWLSLSGALDLRSLTVLIQSRKILIATLGTWIVASVILSTIRWGLLLRAAGAKVTAPRAVALQVMALFFNGIIPGNVGGDVLKNAYALPGRRADILVLSLSERVAGLVGLVWVAVLGVAAGFADVHRDPRLTILLWILGALALGTLLLPLVVLFLHRRLASVDLGNRPAWLKGTLQTLVSSLSLVRQGRRHLLLAVLVSMTMHACNLAYFALLTQHLGNAGAELSRILLVFPLGILTLVFPVSPLGAGYVAFHQLFKLVGLQGGATVFNTYIVGQLAPCVVGAIPYLLMGRAKPEGLPEAT